ncbi:N-alpha-acetyltransferase 40 [Apis mellifera]|uniref:N-alpha-acetyltransferase 40 n=1 Tax=Apis mellifera TaxID=7460 RepID=A0A7M7H0F0_APIME|nr:N-alpha-acetyltransferase 40 [Apis mellifera]|eukprot:XP_006567972.1 N-alpha-acetyltransferase 40 [Apis mellifera]
MKKRKTRRQLLIEKEAIAKNLVDKANSVKNPIEHLHFFHKYITKDNEIIELSCMRAKDADSKCISWIFDIMERNMKSLYEQSNWGWDPIAKQKELTESTAWYLIASSNDKFVGFSHFRFDVDYREEVLYCYEIQLEYTIRRKGLGHFMMFALESMASENKMRKVILTVFKHNPSAMHFFYSLGYKIDKTSPPASDQLDYIILSKAVDSGTMNKKQSSFQ